MSDHVSDRQLQRLLGGDCSADEVMAIVDHIGSCAECAERNRRTNADAGRSIAESFALDSVGDLSPHLALEQLVAAAEGRLAAADREIVESHLEDCEQCRRELRDLERTVAADHRGRRRRINRRTWLWIAAAIAIVVIVASYVPRFRSVPEPSHVIRPHPPTIAVPQPQPSNWDILVQRVVDSGQLPIAHRDGLASVEGSVRGGESAHRDALSPAGIVVPTVRPTFHWRAVAGATYVVMLVPSGGELRESAALHANPWQPPFDLEWGRRYEWQVRATRRGDIVYLPAPPHPPAVFRIIDRASFDDLAKASKERPADHLLLAALYARAGLINDARVEVERLREDPARAALAARLREQLASTR